MRVDAIGRKRWAFDDVRNFVESNQCNLISDVYKNIDTQMEFICSCGTPFTMTFRVFRAGTRCPNCHKKPGPARRTQAQIQKFFSDSGCELVSEYIGVDDPISYICACGRPHTSTFRCFRDGARCPVCKREKLLETRYRFSYDYVANYFKEQGCTLLSTHYYSGKAQYLDYVCKCGRPSKIKFHAFKSGSRCFQCMVDGLSGENSRWYNPNLTDEEREIRNKRKRKAAGYRPWKRQVHERDNFQCQKCGSSEHLEAHHIFSFAEHVQLRFIVENGITLCKACHVAFHTIYTTMNNNKEQLDEFLK